LEQCKLFLPVLLGSSSCTVRHDDDLRTIVGEAIIGKVIVGFDETSIVEDNAFGDEIFINGDLGFGGDSMPTLPSGNWVSNVNKFGLGIS
jgi:hypothetical protein